MSQPPADQLCTPQQGVISASPLVGVNMGYWGSPQNCQKEQSDVSRLCSMKRPSQEARDLSVPGGDIVVSSFILSQMFWSSS